MGKLMAKKMERIVAAAIRVGEEIVTLPPPARHHTLIKLIFERNDDGERVIIQPEDQAFITDTGRFISRVDAAVLAIANGQIEFARWGKELYSEDLW
jgi:hypothetical protein